MAGSRRRVRLGPPIDVAPWVVTALLLGAVVLALAAALLLVPTAQRPTLEPAPTVSSSR